MSDGITKSVVEGCSLDWLGELGYETLPGLAIAPGEPAAEWADYKQVFVFDRLQTKLEDLNPKIRYFSQLQRCCINGVRAERFNPVGVVFHFNDLPRVVRCSQPWAEGRSPFGAEKSRGRVTPRDALLPKLLSGELRVPAATPLLEATK
jgi:hypothetical protein